MMRLNKDLGSPKRRGSWKTSAWLILLFVCSASADSSLGLQPASDTDRQFAREIFEQLIDTDTSHTANSITQASAELRRRLLDAGFSENDISVIGPNERKQNLVVRYRGRDVRKAILIIGHLDVVDAKRSDWTTDPFHFLEKDGFFYGRGTQDMKDNDAILVADFIRLRREGYQPDRDLILALTADEENGPDDGVAWLAKNRRELLNVDFAINADSGGVELDHGKPLVVGVEAAEKLYADYVLTVSDRGGHSSLPHPGNPISHLSAALDRLEHSPFPFELNAVTRDYLSNIAVRVPSGDASAIHGILQNPPDPAAFEILTHNVYYNALLRTTCVPTRISGGHANNALPQTASANVNCRILPGHSAEEIRQDLIRTFNDSSITVKYGNFAGMVFDSAPDSKSFAPLAIPKEVIKPLQQIAEQMWPGTPVIPEMETGASDSVYTIAAGIPTYGISGIALDNDDIRAHGKDERLPVESFYRGLDFFYFYLKALTQTGVAR